MQIDVARAELARSYQLSDYEAVDVAWVALVKVGNTRQESNEHKRICALFANADEEAIRRALLLPGVNVLLDIHPPLETILTNGHERLDAEKTKKELAAVRQLRETDPKRALLALLEIIQRIRNRRVHGFKTPYALRDAEILGATAPVLRAVCEIAIHAVSTYPIVQADT